MYYAPLILEYSKALRPAELAGPRKGRDTPLEIWLAPGNSEMVRPSTCLSAPTLCPARILTPTFTRSSQEVAKNTQSLDPLPLPLLEVLPPLTAVSPDIGFEPEIYQNGEQGFRVKRDSAGSPVGKVVEVTMTSPAELERLKEQQQQQ